MTDTRRRAFLAAATAALGVVVGGLLGFIVGWRLASPTSGTSEPDSVVLQVVDGLVGVVPYLWLGTLAGAALGWVAAPQLVGFSRTWPRVWLALGVQVVTGVVLWLALSFIASITDIGSIAALPFVLAVIAIPPAAGRWFAEHGGSAKDLHL